MARTRSPIGTIVLTAALVASAFVFNPSAERHRDGIRGEFAGRSALARVLPLGSLAAFASNYHSLGVASYTRVGDLVVSVGALGYVHVLNP